MLAWNHRVALLDQTAAPSPKRSRSLPLDPCRRSQERFANSRGKFKSNGLEVARKSCVKNGRTKVRKPVSTNQSTDEKYSSTVQSLTDNTTIQERAALDIIQEPASLKTF